MSILIKGMKKPKNCHECPFLYVTSICDGFKDCPIATVPPHGRLIDADKIVKYIADGINSGKFGYAGVEILTEIQYAPTIIEAEKGENNAND